MRVTFEEFDIGGISSRITRLLLPAYIVLAVGYIAWRFSTVPTWNVWYAYLLLFAETYSIVFTILYLITSRKMLQPVKQPPLEGAVVDIFITTYNEPEEIIKMTALGALNVRGRRDVYILDDGNRPEVRKLALKLGAKYVSRETNVHAKAGNMNNGIRKSDAEFIVFLDCDHVPQPNFIERTSGYFRDENLAFVQTPQLFYNGDSIQFRKTRRRDFWNEQSMFYESIQPAKNAFNAAFFCGSGSMLRRAAVDSIDGFATGTATEDIHTSLRMHARGWSSIFLNEQLAHGIAAEDLGEFSKQRARWGAGSLGLLFRSPDSPFRAKGLTPMQRICYINSTITFLNGGLRLFYIALPAWILIFLPMQQNLPNLPAVTYTSVALPFIAISFIVTYIFSRRTYHPLYTEQFNIASIFPSILAAKGIINVQKKFKVSIKSKQFKKESNAYRALFGIFAVTFVAAVAGPLYWFMYYERSMTELLGSIVGVSMLWNIINMLFIGSVLWYVNFHSEKLKSEHHLVANMPLQLPEGDLKLVRISLRGAEIARKEPFEAETVRLALNPSEGKPVKLVAKVLTSRREKDGLYHANVAFEDLKLAQSKSLTNLMFRDIVPNVFSQEFDKRRTLPPGMLRGRLGNGTVIEPEA